MKNAFTHALALALALVMVLTLAACGDSAENENKEPESIPHETVTADKFDYSAELEDNGFWKGVTALDLVTLPEDYAHIKLSAEAATVTDEALQEMLDNIMASQSADYEKITDRAVEKDDQVSIDYVGSVDGVEFVGGNTNGQGAIVTAGSNQYIDDFLTQIIGHKPGETMDVVVTFPEGYNDSQDTKGNPMVLANKEAVFKTTINYIQGEKIVPELTDEFVEKNFGPALGLPFSYTTVAELKEGLKQDMLNSQKSEYTYQYLLKNSTVTEIPENVTEHLVNAAIYEMKTEAARYGMTFDELLQAQGMTETLFTDMVRKNSAESAKMQLVMQAIAESENLTVSEDDVRKDLGEDYEGIVNLYGKGYTSMVTLNNAVMELILNGAAA